MVNSVIKLLKMAGLAILFLVIAQCMYMTSFKEPRDEVTYRQQLQSEAALKVRYDLIDGEGDIRKQHMFLVLEPDSPFYKAGLRSGDQVIPPHPSRFYDKIWAHQGKTLPVVVERDGKIITANVPIPVIP